MTAQQKGLKWTEHGVLYELPRGGVSNPFAFIGVHLRLIFDKDGGKQYD